MTLNEIPIESAVYSLIGTIVVTISLGYILFLYFKNPALLAFLRYIPSSTAPVSCFLALTAGFFPWLGYFISAILSALPRGEEEILNPEGPGLFILVWLGVFAFFGLFSGDGLLLTTCVPAMSALTGLFIDRVTAKDEIKKMQKRRKSARRRTCVRQRRFSTVEKADNHSFGEIR